MNILNKQSRKPTRGDGPAWGLGEVLTILQRKKYHVVYFLLGNSPRLNFVYQRFGTLCLFHLQRPMKMEQTE